MSDLVIISRQRLVGRTNGSSTYLLDLAEAARAAGHTPHLVQPSPTIMGRTPILRIGRALDVFASHRVRGVVRVGSYMVSVDPRLYTAAARAVVAGLARRLGLGQRWTIDRPNPYSVAIPWNAADRAFVRAHSRGMGVAFADYVFQAEAFGSLAESDAATAIVMHDLFHARPTSGAGADDDSVAALDRDTEVALLGRADAVIAIQRAEADFVARHQPGVRVLLAPMAAHPVANPMPGGDDDVLFVGSNTAPNVSGLKWFLSDAWPAVRARNPDVQLTVAGTVARAFGGAAPPGVRFLGLVDDLDALYARAGVVISPLTFGSGLKIKLVEALAHGKAVVATGVTLQGVEDCADAVVRADDAGAFSDAVATLCRDRAARLRLAAAALATAQARFSPGACYGPLAAWLDEVAAR